MPNDMTPKRGYAFKDFSRREPTKPLPGDRLDTELDRILQALKNQTEYFTRAINPDGTIRGRIITRENIKPDVLDYWTDQVGENLKPLIETAQIAEKNTQNWLTQAQDASRQAQEARDETQRLRTQSLTALETLETATRDLSGTRSRTERAAQQTLISLQNAQTSASSARISEDMAYRWAEKLDGPVFVPNGGDPQDDGFYSSKWWARYTESTVEFGSYWYLGPKAQAPATGNDGQPLAPGMWYFDTSQNLTLLWDGSTWVPLSGGEGGGSVVSVFGRQGAVVAQEGDYAAFYYTKAEVDQSQSAQDTRLDALDGDVARNAADILLRAVWKEPYAVGPTYQANDMVRDNGWLMIANKQTTDRAAPQEIGEPRFVYTGNAPLAQTTAKFITMGQRVQVPATDPTRRYVIDGIRFWATQGQSYTAFLVRNPGTPEQQRIGLGGISTQTSGWTELNTSSYILPAGEVIDVALQASAPADVPAFFDLTFDYQTPANLAVPAAGQIIHARNSPDTMRVHKLDPQLNTLSIGDIITTGSTRWTILSLQDGGTYWQYSVTPAVVETITGTRLFTFETTVPADIVHVQDTDFWTANPDVAGFVALDQGYNNITLNETQYSIDLRFTELLFSEDWDVMAPPSSSGGGDGGNSGSGGIRTEVDPTGVASWKITGDVLECWGTAPSGAPNPLTINLPKAFDGPYSVQVTPATDLQRAASAHSKLPSSFQVNRFFTHIQNQSSTVAIEWRAIGKLAVDEGQVVTDFVLEVVTTQPNQSFTVPLTNGVSTGTVDMGNGDGDQAFSAYNDPVLTTVYATPNTYTIRIRAGSNVFGLNAQGRPAAERSAMRRVLNFGNVQWNGNMFAGLSGTGITSFVFGETQTQNVQIFESFLAGMNDLTTVDFRRIDLDNCATFARMLANTPSLTSVLNMGEMVMPTVPWQADEMFLGSGINKSLLDMRNWDFTNLKPEDGPGLNQNSLFKFIDDNEALDPTMYAEMLVNMDQQTIAPGCWFGFGTTQVTDPAAITARRNLILKGMYFRDALLTAPDAPPAPTLSVISSTEISVDHAPAFNNGHPITRVDMRHSTDQANWTETTNSGDPAVISGLTAGQTYFVQTRAANFEGTGPWSASASTTISGSDLVVNAEGQEVTAFVDDTNPNSLTYTVDGVDYNQDKINGDAPFTAADIAARPVCVKLPELIGTPTEGNTLTVDPGIWLYSEDDTMDFTNRIENAATTVVARNVNEYVVQAGDVPLTLFVTYNGQTAQSIPVGA